MRRRLHLHSPGTVSLALFSLAFGVYLSTVSPSITWSNFASDSGELASAVATLGVAHPPGYPTYVLVGKLFSFLPFGDTAHRLNIMSAFFAATAVALTFLTSIVVVELVSLRSRVGVHAGGASLGATGRAAPRWYSHYAPAAIAALALAFAPTFWSQATVTEVYALNAFFGATVAYLLLSWLLAVRRSDSRVSPVRPLAAAFLFGLGLGDHLTLAGLVLPLAAAVFWRGRRLSRVSWGWMALALVLGLAVYVYLPVRAPRNPPINWGDPGQWSGFAWDVSARPYQGFVFGLPTSLWPDRLRDWGKLMVDQFQGVGVIIGLIGFARLWRWDRVIAAALAASFLGISVYAIFYNAGDSFVFLIPALFVASLAIAAGAHSIGESLASYAGLRSASQKVLPALLAFAAVAGAALVPGTTLARNYAEQNLRHDSAARAFAAEVFRAVEPGAVILARGDRPLFALWYQQFVVDKETSVFVVSRNLLDFDWYIDNLRKRHPELVPADLPEEYAPRLMRFVSEQVEKRPVYMTDEDPVLRPSFGFAPAGPVFRVKRLPPS